MEKKKKVKGGLGFEGIKGGKKGKEGAFFFWAEIEDYRGRGETDWFTGRSWESSAYVSGSSAFEAS
jgi:hypothetical protein